MTCTHLENGPTGRTMISIPESGEAPYCMLCGATFALESLLDEYQDMSVELSSKLEESRLLVKSLQELQAASDANRLAALSRLGALTVERDQARYGEDDMENQRDLALSKLDLLRKMALEGENKAVIAALCDEATMKSLLDGDRDLAHNFPAVEIPDPITEKEHGAARIATESE